MDPSFFAVLTTTCRGHLRHEKSPANHQIIELNGPRIFSLCEDRPDIKSS